MIEEDNTTWIYVFARVSTRGLTAPVNIGISQSVGSRLTSVQTSCPFKIDLAYVFECPTRDIAQFIESGFHETQAIHNEFGEWFSFEPIEAIHLLCIAFRSILSVKLTDPDLILKSLDCAGVLWAERKFGLATPADRTLQ